MRIVRTHQAAWRSARRFGWISIVGALALALAPAAALATMEKEDFKIRSAQDLVDLCSVTPENELYARAIEFCHGFVSGAYHYHEAQAAGPGGDRIVCLPNPPPSRSDAIADFLAWAAANPSHMSEPAVEALFRYLSAKYPCPAAGSTEGASQ